MTLPLMTRRAALMAGGALFLAGSAGALTLSRQAGDRKFVLVILRGALDGLAERLRLLPKPVIGRISDGRLLLDLRCVKLRGGFRK